MKKELEEGQIILCIVEKIVGTVVFVKIEGDGEGTIVTSEISPGRIRNLRDYVAPGKRIVCKILKIKGNEINLSLRRVKLNEKKEVLEKQKKQKSSEALLKTILKDKAEKIINQIKRQTDIAEFIESAKQNPKLFEKYLSKKEAEKILDILKQKKTREIEIKKTFYLINKKNNGIIIIKKILKESCKNPACEISYLAAGKYLLKIKNTDGKTAKTLAQQTISSIETLAKKSHSEFSEEKTK